MESGYKSLRKREVRKRTQTRTTGKRRKGRQEGAKQLGPHGAELLKKTATLSNGRLAVEVMDDEIAQLEELMKVLYPWDQNGEAIKSKSVNAYYWAAEMRRDYLALRAPYQSPRLSSVQVLQTPTNKRPTEVHVTILNERGQTEYTDAPDDGDLKLIEHAKSDDEAA